jgi:CHRD domain
MKIYSLRAFNFGWAVLLSVLILTGCGGDNNPISPGNAQITQISSVNSQVPQNVFSSTLTGAQEVPSVTSIGSGTGVVSVDPATNQMRATIVTADVNGTQAHIQLGATGVTGPVVFSLTENEAGSGVWATTATLTTDQLTQLTAGNYYFNVHTAAYPDGEIRGQILAQLPPSGSAINTTSSTTVTSAGGTDTSATASGSSSTGATPSSASTNGVTAYANANRVVFFMNQLSGSLVVPANASTATATGLAAYHPTNRLLTAVVVSRDLAGTGSSIRQAAAGAIGPVVGSFTETLPGSGIWVLRTVLTATQATALNNGGMYYELLSPEFPAGELRGQIVRTEGTTTPVTPTTTTAPAISGATTTNGVTPATTTVTTLIASTTPTAVTTPTNTIATPTNMSATPSTTITPTTTTTMPTTTAVPTITTPALTPSAMMITAATDTMSASPSSRTTTTTTSRTASTTFATTAPTVVVTPVTTSANGSTEMSPLSIAAQ